MNDIISYTSRDFNSIKTDLINAIPTLTDIWTNREDADPGMVLLNFIAALGDNLNLNMDKQSMEFYSRYVTQRKNAVKVFDLIDYRMHWYKSAQLNLEIFNNSTSTVTMIFNEAGENSQRIVSNSIATAPPYFILYPDENATNWNKSKTLVIPAGQSIKLNAIQGELSSTTFNASAIDSNNRYYLPFSRLDQDHIWLDDDKKYQWYLVDNINELTETLPRFEFGVDEYNLPYIQFVPYWRSSFGEDHKFTIYYISTRGVSGNITANTLNVIPALKSFNVGLKNTDISIIHGSNNYDNNNLENVPGKDPQTANEAYLDSRNYIGTYNTLVTLIDFENFINRIPLMSVNKAVDGQLATELNEKMLNDLKMRFKKDPDKAFELYEKNKIVCEANFDDEEEQENFGFLPYNLQIHAVAGDFDTKVNDLTIPKYADETEVELDSTNNDGYISYELTDAIIGSSDDSVISQSGIDKYKVFTSVVDFAPIRKFPFYIDGKIHTKEPVRPAEANMILFNVYSALVNRFSAENLTIGEKIKFKDVLDTINSADDRIYYFDAGANNSNGSLIVYPTSGDTNYFIYNPDTESYSNYGITVNPEYFNAISLQHYADAVQSNNVLLYFANTMSEHLTIADDSVKDKTEPAMINTELSVTMKEVEVSGQTKLTYVPKLTLITDEESGTAISDPSKLYRYAMVAQIYDAGGTYDVENAECPLRFYDAGGEVTDISGDIWVEDPQVFTPFIEDPETEEQVPQFRTHVEGFRFVYDDAGNPEREEYESDDGYVIAMKVIETITSKESSLVFSGIAIAPIQESGDD